MGMLSTIWILGAGACLALAVVNLFTWRQLPGDRRPRAYAWLIGAIFAAACYALCEAARFHTPPTADVSWILRGMQMSLSVFVLSLTWFVAARLNTSCKWLAWTVTDLWLVCLGIILFSKHDLWFGPWQFLFNMASMVFLIYLSDATLRWCRQAPPRHAANIGGGLVLLLAVAGLKAALRHWGGIESPDLLAPVMLIVSFVLVLSLQHQKSTEQIIEHAVATWEPPMAEQMSPEQEEDRADPEDLSVLEVPFLELEAPVLDTDSTTEEEGDETNDAESLAEEQSEQLEPEPDTVRVELELALSEMTYRHARLEAENAYLKYQSETTTAKERMIGDSPAIKSLWQQISLLAESHAAAILVTGEAGVGKELVVQRLHTRGPRSHRTMVTVRCAVLSAGELDSELFGDGTDKRPGKLALAEGSTLFLDEIATLPLTLQDRLLNAVKAESGTQTNDHDKPGRDIQIIATTRFSLDQEVEEGRFLPDLYDCLREQTLSVPPLRERVDDIPLLAQYWMDQLALQQGKPVTKIPKLVMRRLQAYPWPGNVRELKNILERAVIASEGPELRLPGPLVRWPGAESPQETKTTESVEGMKNLAQIQSDYILKVLLATQGKLEGKTGAASILGLKPSTLRNRMRKLGVSRSQLPLVDIQPPTSGSAETE